MSLASTGSYRTSVIKNKSIRGFKIFLKYIFIKTHSLTDVCVFRAIQNYIDFIFCRKQTLALKLCTWIVAWICSTLAY